MVVKKQEIFSETNFTNHLTGERTPNYKPVGFLIEFDNGRTIIELNMFPRLELVVMPDKRAPEKKYDFNDFSSDGEKWGTGLGK